MPDRPVTRAPGLSMFFPAYNDAGTIASLVIQALDRSHGNQTKAATLLGMNRDQIRYRIEKYGLTRPVSDKLPASDRSQIAPAVHEP